MSTEECKLAFHKLKQNLDSLPLLAIPKHNGYLFLYLVVSSKVINIALVHEEQGVQQPVYYISKAF